MQTKLGSWATVLAVGALVVACAKVPYTGRRQYNVVPNGIMRGLGKSSYSDMLAEVKVQRKGDDAATLTKVGGRISAAANEPEFDWSYALIDDDTVNAWCLPGGYIGFYTGILPVLENEAGMAFVMGHEVGHATAHHGAERLTQQLTMIGGLVGLEVYLANKTRLEPKERGVILAALGVGSYVGVLLPFSRMHESEADVIGMMYMAKAGYPPQESIRVWDRMAEIAGKNPLPAFLSTHPAHDKRQANLREWMPAAKKKYERNKLSYDSTKTLWASGSTAGTAPGTAGDDRATGVSRPRP